MDKTYNIPLQHKSGMYPLGDLDTITDDNITLEYWKYGDIFEYDNPNSGRNIRLYGIPNSDFEQTLKALYSKNRELKSLTVTVKNKDILMYIHYDNEEDTRNSILDCSKEIADIIIEKISQCSDVVSRLFIEYFSDGEYFDIHAKIGTPEEQKLIEEKYGKDSGDWAGNYSSKNIYGDNGRLGIMVQCSEDTNSYFKIAVEKIISKVEENAVTKLNKTDDFKFIVCEYD